MLAPAILIFVPASKGRVTWLLRRRSLVGIGLVSYSAYLWHQPLFDFARIALPEPPKRSIDGRTGDRDVHTGCYDLVVGRAACALPGSRQARTFRWFQAR